MRLHRSVQAVLTAGATLAASAGMVIGATTAAQAAAPTPLPAHVFAPYFEAYNGDNPATLASQSGNKYLSMAFIQAATKGSCTAYWNGDTSSPVAAATFGSQISSIQAGGGDVVPSFGGYAADDGGTEIADSCTDVNQIAAQYENVITTYNVSRIDLDTEDNSLTNTAGIDRRNKAIKLVEDWATANGRNVQFSYTLPTTTSGLAASGLAVLKNAVTNNARIDVVNIMTFDYYDGATHEMATDAENAASGLYGQLAKLYPTKTAAQLWGSIGITLMPGIDDYGAAETTTVADAGAVQNWATTKGVNTLSFWALQRDNGGCLGTAGSDTCSGISQGTWDFSHALEPFTSGGGVVTNDFSLSASPASGSVLPGASTSATVSTAVTSGSAQSVALSVSGAPAGVTASLSPTSVTAGGSSTLTISTTAAVAPGSYPLTITGTAASGSHTATYTLTVNGTTTNDFSLSVSPASGSVTAGAGATAAVSTAVTSGSAQSVALSVSGAPAGVTASLSPTSVTAGAGSTLTISTTAAVAPGSYPLTITGTAASGSHTATYTLTVNGSSGGSGLANGGFETGSLSPWTCQTGGAVVSTPAHSGSHALQVTPTAAQTGECDQAVTLLPNHAYTLTGWVQGNYAYIGVSGGATGSTWANSSSWTQLTVPFTTDATGKATVYVHGWYGQGNVLADDFAIN
ncbi:glycosyl hydrolase family 18 protein [Kitasatospora sp. NBC_01287]|uniref:carbohydrate binding domain-containing protein n=1 Tax=Kitasatospora sp. NBC_01287 TaxID=2903573 RepID=UPI0022580600|nr:glycosyl hydrolase family 18 protein [Kitasatospora sp. NBC_01287]MCX4745450.1 glycosyl hydrolase family 18 protein [Kitasatospora sp. NBC_01287]